MDMQGKTVIVTGSGTGIGRALALEFARAGANVVCCGRRAQPIQRTAELAEQGGAAALAIPTDVTQPEQVAALVSRTLERFGRIDVLFNNAGSFRSIAGVWELDGQIWWNDVKVNLLGGLLMIRHVLPHMMQRDEGIIINMDGGRPIGGSGYACGKAGLMELTRVLVEELKSAGSHVIVFSAGPGLVRTEMTEYQAETEAGRKWIPSTRECFQAGKLRRPEEIAQKTLRVVQSARIEMSGLHFEPDRDFPKE